MKSDERAYQIIGITQAFWIQTFEVDWKDSRRNTWSHHFRCSFRQEYIPSRSSVLLKMLCVISSTFPRLGNSLCGKKHRLKSQAREMAKKKQMELVKGSGRQTCVNQNPFNVPCSCILFCRILASLFLVRGQFGWWIDRRSNALCSPRMLRDLVLVVGFPRSNSQLWYDAA